MIPSLFKGLNRTVIRRHQQRGEALVLCKAMREQAKQKFVFAHMFLGVSWNLICRVGNSVPICYEHLECDDDALAIWLKHMKNVQEGERQRDPRHVYAKPKEPDICPILAWAIYFAVFGNPYDRYSNVLQKVLGIASVATKLKNSGRVTSDLSLILPCCTGGPSSASISLIAGWIGICLKHKTHMLVTKLHVIASSDVLWLAYLTKHRCLLAFLPSLKAWMERCETVLIFVPSKLKYLAITCGRSFVYHDEHFLKTLDKNHVFLSSPLFCDIGLPQILNKKLIYRRWCPGDMMRASGIAPHLR
ncbi:hypothetical protein PHMEG_00028988 [Phytophthora megakarya]|uniref:Uncharacterized protein n=1 Tax=Phytophthora megakarya TaxID=4795 RepID=A0A225V4R9_9STRA|nr:hypothetical protein PHMEG_00028988 [Phytophthora megakarya]